MLQVMQEALKSDAPRERVGITRQELEEMLGWSGEKVLKILKILKARGMIAVAYAPRENLVGIMSSVPVYMLKPIEGLTEEAEAVKL